MLWPGGDTDASDDAREQQRRREAYARELDHQIELRRARQREEQLEMEELERKFAPSERSPAKWLVEGGHFDMSTALAATSEPSPSPWRFAKRGEELVAEQDEQQQDRGASTGEAVLPNSVSLSHPRFRVTDESETSERLRERAQRMQWKRLLDEQVEENARLKEQQEAERRRSEADAAREEMMYLRDQQLRAQRRLGQFSPAAPASSSDLMAEPSPPPYRAVPSPPQPRHDFKSSTNFRQDFPLRNDTRVDENASSYYQRDRQYGTTPAAAAVVPPPAPSRLQMQPSNRRIGARDDGQTTFNRSSTTPRTSFPLDNDPQMPRPQQQSQVIDEYRSLLAEIRREREELRRERDDVRREKEELRVQRALLQLENEKMASLVDAQRALNEQQHADLQTQQEQQQYQALSYQPRLSPVRSVGFEAGRSHRGGGLMDHPDRNVPATQGYSRLNQMRESLGHLAIGEEQHATIQVRRRQPPSPMSMADFSTAVPSHRMTPNVVDSPRFQRLSRYRPIPVVEERDENPLNQSLVGDSVFLPLSPTGDHDQEDLAQRIPGTSSPKAADKRHDVTSGRPNPLRNSRVIKSRGFYNLEQELVEQDALRVDASASSGPSASGSHRGSLGSALSSSYYEGDYDDDASETDDDQEDRDDHSDDSDEGEVGPAAARSGLFQVQVLT
ncbi:hypothetical protein BBJ28_00000199 [Nothophytophthora sp. Chile5]|nr:hypothetical protein BBJ28_00000199 [Nothophytophthora sp. Chile5]